MYPHKKKAWDPKFTAFSEFEILPGHYLVSWGSSHAVTKPFFQFKDRLLQFDRLQSLHPRENHQEMWRFYHPSPGKTINPPGLHPWPETRKVEEKKRQTHFNKATKTWKVQYGISDPVQDICLYFFNFKLELSTIHSHPQSKVKSIWFITKAQGILSGLTYFRLGWSLLISAGKNQLQLD